MLGPGLYTTVEISAMPQAGSMVPPEQDRGRDNARYLRYFFLRWIGGDLKMGIAPHPFRSMSEEDIRHCLEGYDVIIRLHTYCKEIGQNARPLGSGWGWNGCRDLKPQEFVTVASTAARPSQSNCIQEAKWNPGVIATDRGGLFVVARQDRGEEEPAILTTPQKVQETVDPLAG